MCRPAVSTPSFEWGTTTEEQVRKCGEIENILPSISLPLTYQISASKVRYQQALKKIHCLPVFSELQICMWVFAVRTLVLQRERQAQRHVCIYFWIPLQSKPKVKLGSRCFAVWSPSFSSGNCIRHPACQAAARTNTILVESQRQKGLNDEFWSQVATFNSSSLLKVPCLKM